MKNYLNLDKTQTQSVLDKCFSFQKPKNSFQIVCHIFIREFLNVTISSQKRKGWLEKKIFREKHMHT